MTVNHQAIEGQSCSQCAVGANGELIGIPYICLNVVFLKIT